MIHSTLLIALSFLVSPAQAKQETWSQKMQQLNQDVIELLLITGTGEKRLSSSEEKKVGEIAKSLSTVAHDIDLNKPSVADTDPTLNYLGSAFHDEAKRAYETFKLGQKEYSYRLLRSLTQYCFACHSRAASGPQFSPNKEQERRLMRLSELDQADFYAATRNYDAALQRYEHWISDSKSALARTFDWERAVKAALVVTIRVMNNPDKSMKILELATANTEAPFFMRDLMQSWKTTVATWQKEGTRTPKTGEGLFAEGTRLMSEAKTLQKFPADRSADILYLRATAMLHSYLQGDPRGTHAAEAFYLLGVAYEVLRFGPIWNIPEFYFVSCIQAKPNTMIARQCFNSAEVSIYNGYTGSGGTFIPAEVKKKLQKLDILSLPENEKKKETIR